jgi:uncharacterized membrane protein
MSGHRINVIERCWSARQFAYQPACAARPRTSRALRDRAARWLTQRPFRVWWLVALAVWDVAAVAFLAWIWWSVWSADAAGTARHSQRDDPARAASDSLLIGASLASLAAVGIILVRASHSSGVTRGVLVGASIVSIVLAWSVVHTVFCLRYARLYYEGTPGGNRLQRRRSTQLRRLWLSGPDDRDDLSGL